jgi:enoyl-CoA hydratase/carnithine racemase
MGTIQLTGQARIAIFTLYRPRTLNALDTQLGIAAQSAKEN